MKSNAITKIEEALEPFPPDEQERLGRHFVRYLEEMKALRDALAEGERAYAEGRFVTLEEFMSRMDTWRDEHAGD